jgi:hypothetical protein
MTQKIILNLLQKEVLTIEDASVIENAIDNGFVDTCDLFEDFVTYVLKNANVDYNTLMDFQEQYENLKSHRENLKHLLE